MEDSLRLLNTMEVDGELREIKNKAMESGLAAVKTQIWMQQCIFMGFDKSPEVAVKFSQTKNSTELTPEQNKIAREIEKELGNKRSVWNKAEDTGYAPAPKKSRRGGAQQFYSRPQYAGEFMPKFAPYQQPTQGFHAPQMGLGYSPMYTASPQMYSKPTRNSRGKFPASSNICNYCEQPGHWAEQCPMTQSAGSAAHGVRALPPPY